MAPSGSRRHLRMFAPFPSRVIEMGAARQVVKVAAHKVRPFTSSGAHPRRFANRQAPAPLVGADHAVAEVVSGARVRSLGAFGPEVPPSPGPRSPGASSFGPAMAGRGPAETSAGEAMGRRFPYHSKPSLRASS